MKFSEQELLELKAKINGEIAVSIYDLTFFYIPDLVDEILELRKEIKTLKEIHNYSGYGDWRDIYG